MTSPDMCSGGAAQSATSLAPFYQNADPGALGAAGNADFMEQLEWVRDQLFHGLLGGFESVPDAVMDGLKALIEALTDVADGTLTDLAEWAGGLDGLRDALEAFGTWAEDLPSALDGTYGGDDDRLLAVSSVARAFRSVLSGGGLFNLGQLTTAPVNLLPSGGFDTDGTVAAGEGWSHDPAVGRTAPGSARFDGTGDAGLLFSPVPAEVEAGKTYSAGCWVSWDGVTAVGPAFTPFVRWSDASGAVLSETALPPVTSPPSASSGWVELSAVVTAPASARWAHLAFQVESGVLGTVWWDDAGLWADQETLPQSIISGLTAALSQLGEDVEAALGRLKDLIERLTGQARATLTEAIADALAFGAQLKTILSGGSVGSPLPNLLGSVIGTNQTVLNQIADILRGLAVTPINAAVQGVKDWFTGLGSWQASQESAVTAVETVADQIATNINSAVAEGVKVGTGAVETVFDTIADLLGLARTARDIAVTAQSQVQTITNDTEAPAELNGIVWSTVFSGADDTALASGDWTVSNIVIKGGQAGIADGAADDSLSWAVTKTQFATDGQSASVVLGSPRGKSGFYECYTGLYVRANVAFTKAAYCHVRKNGWINVGKMTRSGSTFTFTQLATVSATVAEGDLVRFRTYGQNYYVVVNGITKLSWTDSGSAISSGAGYRCAGFTEQRKKFSDFFSTWTNDGYRVASFAMSDWLPAGVNVATAAWRIRRGSGGEVALSVGHGAQAAMPSGFYTVTDLAAAGVSVTDLGTGQVTVPEDGWYEIAATSINRDNFSDRPEIDVNWTGEAGDNTQSWRASPWVLYVDGTAVAGPIMSGMPTTVYLASGQVVRPGVSASSPLTGAASHDGASAIRRQAYKGRSAITHISGAPSASFTGRKVG